MTGYDIARLIIVLISIIIIGSFAIKKLFVKRTVKIDARFITRTAIFSAIAIILYTVPFLKFSVPFFPAFLEIHFDEVPALIAGLAYGPLSGIFVIVIKTIVKLPMTTSLCVGELTDLLYGLVLVIPVSVIYNRNRTIKRAAIGLGISTLSQVIFASFFTTFVILNFYMLVMGLSQESILKMCQAINPNITSLTWPFLLMVALPFNLFKDVLVIIITFILYKRLHKLIDKIGNKKTR